MVDLVELRSRFNRIVSAPRGAATATVRPSSTRSFSAYVNEDVDEASAIAARLGELTRHHGGGAEGLDAALSEAERLLATETTRGLVQYALKLFITHDPIAQRFLRLGPLERRQPNAVRGVLEPRDDKNDEKE